MTNETAPRTRTRKLAALWRMDPVTGVRCLSWEMVDVGRRQQSGRLEYRTDKFNDN